MYQRTVDVDNVSYHADNDGELLLDEDGDPIPSHICICFAHSDNECVCGAWSRPIPGVDECFYL